MKKGLSIRKLAAISGISQSTISQVESSEVNSPTVSTLEKLAPHYGLTLAEIVTCRRMGKEPVPDDVLTMINSLLERFGENGLKNLLRLAEKAQNPTQLAAAIRTLDALVRAHSDEEGDR